MSAHVGYGEKKRISSREVDDVLAARGESHDPSVLPEMAPIFRISNVIKNAIWYV